LRHNARGNHLILYHIFLATLKLRESEKMHYLLSVDISNKTD